ncbi:lactate utilization protein B [Paraflavisolibacter sp. H34]|uniref:lactate utilization protein B n=1 Tax=Huijunlia imazamoxiresistens TaxID=3127457 RepID=UPI0030189F32
MSEHSSTFKAKSTVKATDREHRRKINFNIARYNAVVPVGKQQFTQLHLARERAKNRKWQALETLDRQLETFEQNSTRRGVKVLWAETAAEARQLILDICRKKGCTTLVKSKSMVTEELKLNEFLAEHEIESVETDLGEYIQQLDNEPPYHIVTPAMHKSKEDVARLFAKKLGTASGLTPVQLTQVARENLREKYREAQVGITGANFLIADTGAVAITENEGNARLSCAWPKTHIVIAGIEKVLPSLSDLGLFWPLLATYGTGQRVTVYNSIIAGPRQRPEVDGPDDMYVILLDNGRTRLLANPKTREALCCIRCGACLNACPVYKNIGGHAYGTTYSGPIGSVITPHLKGLEGWQHLSYASSLCGNCTEVCPVKINLHELLLENRREAVKENYTSLAEKVAWTLWKTAMLNRSLLDVAPGRVKDWVVNKLATDWKKSRGEIRFPPQSFSQLWREKNKKTD